MRHRRYDLRCQLVLVLPLIGDLPQPVLLGPDQVRDLDDYLWAHSVHARELQR